MKDKDKQDLQEQIDELGKIINKLNAKSFIKRASKAVMYDRYPMCKDQPAQIDCINVDCGWLNNNECTNISPAISLNHNKTFVCWSKKDREDKIKGATEGKTIKIECEPIKKPITLTLTLEFNNQDHSDLYHGLINDNWELLNTKLEKKGKYIVKFEKYL